jgi:phenylacetate-CoA oxygenase PaaI subunit
VDSVQEGVAENTALVRLVAALADNKHLLGRRYAEWCTAAPTLESAVAAAAMAQDEIGHARSFYPLLEDVAGKSAETDPETRSHFENAPFLDHPFTGWTDFVAANFLFDSALTVLLDAALDSSLGPLGQRARRIHEEELLHWLHGEGWVRRLSARGGALNRALAASLDAITPDSLALFAVVAPSLAQSGVLAVDSGEIRSQFRQRVNPVLDESGLSRI